MKTLKSIPEQIESTLLLAGFCFFYAARWLKKVQAPELSMSEALTLHTPLLFHGLGYSKKEEWQDIPLCREIIAAADELSAVEAQLFEAEMMARFKDAIAARGEELYPRSRGIYAPPSWNCGSLKYDPPSPEAPDKCMIHIYNTVAPYSLFDDEEYLISCFKVLLKETAMHFGAVRIGCASWLNEDPRWLKFFPPEWQENMSERHPEALPNMSVGAWGFLYDARGCFHTGYGEMLRRNGVRPFLPRNSFCSHEAMLRQLRSLSGK